MKAVCVNIFGLRWVFRSPSKKGDSNTSKSKKVKGYVRYRSVYRHKAKSKSRSGSRGTLVVAHNIMTFQRLSIPNLENAP